MIPNCKYKNTEKYEYEDVKKIFTLQWPPRCKFKNMQIS